MAKSTVLVAERILYPHRSVFSSSNIFSYKSSLVWENKSCIFEYLTIYTCITQPHSQRTITFESVTVVKISFYSFSYVIQTENANVLCDWGLKLYTWITWQYLMGLFVMLFCGFETYWLLILPVRIGLEIFESLNYLIPFGTT